MNNLKEFFLSYGFKLNDLQCKQFQLYYDLLIETNKKFNLTNITQEQDVLYKHFLDSILPEKFFPQNAKVADIGSGAGFPGLPLKIIRADLNIFLVDSLNKRVCFLQYVKNQLKLKNLCCVHSRAEDYCKLENRENFDIATARAVAPLNTLVEYLLPLVKVGGKAIIYKATKLEEELTQAQKAIEILGGKIEKIEKYNLLDNERNILIINKIKNTPNKYPRGQNKPRTSPIS